jgi:hypothetical protein
MQEIETEIQPRTSSGILSSLYKSILHTLNITPTKFAYLMEKHMNDPSNKLDLSNRVKMTTYRGNIKKNLLSDKMTWKFFCMGIRFLQIPKFEIVIRLHNHNGHITEHSKMVHLIGSEEIDDEQHSDGV